MLFATSKSLQDSIQLLSSYKHGVLKEMTPELWRAKKIADATLHPDTGTPVFLPLRMSAFIFTNLIVTAGMLQPNLSTRGVIGWQVANQSLNVCINAANANKSSPMPLSQMAGSFLMAVTASCGVAVGLGRAVARMKVKELKDGVLTGKGVSPGTKAILGRLVPFAAVATAGVLNVGLMRGGEIIRGIDVYASKPPGEDKGEFENLGKSRKAAAMAVGETAASRVINATPIMVIPPLVMMRLQGIRGLRLEKPVRNMMVNTGLIFATSVVALPFALGIFPTRQKVKGTVLEKRFHGKGHEGIVEFNRGI